MMDPTTLKTGTAEALRVFVRERSAQVGYNEAMHEIAEMVADLRLFGSARRHHVDGGRMLTPRSKGLVWSAGAL